MEDDHNKLCAPSLTLIQQRQQGNQKHNRLQGDKTQEPASNETRESSPAKSGRTAKRKRSIPRESAKTKCASSSVKRRKKEQDSDEEEESEESEVIEESSDMKKDQEERQEDKENEPRSAKKAIKNTKNVDKKKQGEKKPQSDKGKEKSKAEEEAEGKKKEPKEATVFDNSTPNLDTDRPSKSKRFIILGTGLDVAKSVSKSYDPSRPKSHDTEKTESSRG